MIKYFQQGGQVTDQQQMQEMFMQYLAEKYQTEDIDTLVQQLQSTPGENGETKLEDELMEFQQVLQQGGQPQVAKNGAKLEYLKKLKGLCPEGTEVSYYKNGNKICSKCIAKQEKGAKNVLISMAGEGAVLVDENGKTHVCGVCKGTVRNSVGAGDSMVAGFVAGSLEGDYEYALKLGTAAGGATAFSDGLATKEKIAELLKTL